jgi:hypothetical protein
LCDGSTGRWSAGISLDEGLADCHGGAPHQSHLILAESEMADLARADCSCLSRKSFFIDNNRFRKRLYLWESGRDRSPDGAQSQGKASSKRDLRDDPGRARFDMATVATLFAVNLLFFNLPPESQVDAATLMTIHRVGLWMTIATVLGIAVLILFRLKTAAVVKMLERLTQRLPERVTKPLIAFVQALSAGLSVLLRVRELLTALFYTLLVWASVGLATWLVLQAFKLDLSLSAAVFVMGFGLIGSLVPSPGGSAGAFHAAAAAGLVILGVEKNLAGSVAIAFHFVAFGPPFLLGLFFLAKDGIGLGSLREMISAPVGATTGDSSSPPPR